MEVENSLLSPVTRDRRIGSVIRGALYSKWQRGAMKIQRREQFELSLSLTKGI